MTYAEIAREVADKLRVLDADGRLVPLDSLTLIDLVAGLERASGLTIPTSAIRNDTFESLAGVTALLEGLAARATG